MNKLELIKKVCDKSGHTQKNVNEMLDALSAVIVEEVRDKGEEITLQGVGIFKQKINEAHKGRNPFNGETIDVKESRTIRFQVSSSVKQVVGAKKKDKK